MKAAITKNILMLCYYYPPLIDVGCKRSVAFSKYLKKLGWNPCVLSVKNPDKTYCTVGLDSPPDGVHTEYSYSIVNVYKFFGKLNAALSLILGLFKINLKRNYLTDFFCFPDIFYGWIPLTTLKALKLIKRHHINLIYVSCSPVSSAVIGALLKLISKKPLILDYRDPFTIEPLPTQHGVPKVRIELEQILQRILLRYTDILIVNNEETKKRFIAQYPAVTSKIFEIHNGFDAEHIFPRKNKKYSKFTIVYGGDYYYSHINPTFFFEGLALLKVKGKIDKTNFQFLFYGGGKDIIRKIAEDLNINDIVTVHDRIPFNDIIEVISRSHLQLLRTYFIMIASKTFEGIPLNIPFLAAFPGGSESKEIIRKYSPSSYIISEESPEEVAQSIVDAISKYNNGEIQDNRILEFQDKFSRENLTIKLINIIESRIK